MQYSWMFPRIRGPRSKDVFLGSILKSLCYALRYWWLPGIGWVIANIIGDNVVEGYPLWSTNKDYSIFGPIGAPYLI